jgi:Tfp pilus assembly protein PilF
MSSRIFVIIAVSLLLIGTGCSSAPIRTVGLDRISLRKADRELSLGIRNYEDGNYKIASNNLQSALDLGLTFNRDAVQAHKYLAFIYCLSKREKQCRSEFRKALDKDSTFDLKPEEAGHPGWGPIFRVVKAEHKK